MKSKFSEEQIVRILKEVDAGAKVAETCRKHGISEAKYYVWTLKFKLRPRPVRACRACGD